jgi:hypothetical protein
MIKCQDHFILLWLLLLSNFIDNWKGILGKKVKFMMNIAWIVYCYRAFWFCLFTQGTIIVISSWNIFIQIQYLIIFGPKKFRFLTFRWITVSYFFLDVYGVLGTHEHECIFPIFSCFLSDVILRDSERRAWTEFKLFSFVINAKQQDRIKISCRYPNRSATLPLWKV